MLVFDTICALSTPPFKSALAVVRLSGNKSLEILSHIIKKDISKVLPNYSFYAKVYKDKENPVDFIDEAIITYYKNPNSYTGFDTIEFSVHGNMIIVEELLDTLAFYGARKAMPGEFSAQAYFNNKMDLLKAEGINDLINATSIRAKNIASNTLSGKNTEIVKELKNRLLSYVAQMEYFVENSYDESEENIDYDDEINKVIESLKIDINNLKELISKTKKANKEYQGFNIAIAGEPNVGKSTLLNAILKENKAIVSPIPGTTRDVVEGECEINGLRFKFKDTAGLRKTDDYVENLGIEKSYQTIKEADLVILASDCSFKDVVSNDELNSALKDKIVIKVATKSDINSNLDGADISICSLKDDTTELLDLIIEKLDLNKKEESSFLGKREEEYLEKINNQLILSLDAIINMRTIDVGSDNIRVAISLTNDLMGNSESQTMEDIYQTLFSKFCLGK